jgi:glycosyltransferase involved in cell wall biosynthesis
MQTYHPLSIIIPAKNESANLAILLPKLKAAQPSAEIIVVDDGSSDDTQIICQQQNIRAVKHTRSKGNGAAIKAGARAANGDIFVFMDGDGQHAPEDIQRLLDKLAEGHDMVVGARSRQSQASVARLCGNTFYNHFASWMVGDDIQDLTSGFRAVRATLFKQFLFMLPNTFSYPTTITMAFFRSGYSVAYLPIVAHKRLGKSHLSVLRDGARFLLIIFKIGTLFSPLKIFLPISFMHLIAAVSWYLYTYLTTGRLTNMSATMFIAAMLIFLIGLVSEQITTLIYRDNTSPASRP